MYKNLIIVLFVALGFTVGSFLYYKTIDWLPMHRQPLTTSGDDVIICMRGKVNKLVYINGHLFDCVPMADHRSVKLYLRGK